MMSGTTLVFSVVGARMWACILVNCLTNLYDSAFFDQLISPSISYRPCSGL